MPLLIVESPSKAKHIKEFLPSNWRVMASLGHIRDLPEKGADSYVRPPNFAMKYVYIDDKHEGLVNEIKKAADANPGQVFLATDPDREGEAIAWHLAKVLGLDVKTNPRVTYQEVTKEAVLAAIANPRTIDMALVAAQEARRGLDRMVGWEVSRPLSQVVRARASAGRVQSPAVVLIVDLERRIHAFKSVTHFGVQAAFDMPNKIWTAQWQAPTNSSDPYFMDKSHAQALADAASNLSFEVSAADKKAAKEPPKSPFTTSEMQQTISRQLKIGVAEVMASAQRLFDTGKITYHRTDSPSLSIEGETMIREYIGNNGMALSPSPRRWKPKAKNAQEAHEAVRPTDCTFTGEGLDMQDRRVYEIIRLRSIASQMPDAQYMVTTASLDAGVFQGIPAVFKATGKVLVDPGWRKIYQDDDEEDAQITSGKQEAKNPVPVLTIGSILSCDEGKLLEKKTQPPPRYTEATLIGDMEKYGIGRPSTYASIISTIKKRGYVTMEKQNMVPTALADQVRDALDSFAFSALDYTSGMEDRLDTISSGGASPKALLMDLYTQIQNDLLSLYGSNTREDLAPCSVEGCTGMAQRQESRRVPGKFYWACSNGMHSLLSDGGDGQPGPPMDGGDGTTAGTSSSHGNNNKTGDGPSCDTCGKPVHVLHGTSKKGAPYSYFSCFDCKKKWWPKKEDKTQLGDLWPPR